MTDIIVSATGESNEREPLAIKGSYYCEWHDALSIIWNCYCGRQNMEVEVRVYEK